MFSESRPKARKAHVCCECRCPILPGQVYVKSEGLWDGNWGTYKTHADCAEVRDELAKYAGQYGECGPCFGGIYEEIGEAHGWQSERMGAWVSHVLVRGLASIGEQG